MSDAAVTAPPAAEAGGQGSEGGAFSPVAGMALVLVGVFAFLAMLVLGSLAPELASGNDGDSHALSKSAIGYGGLHALMKAQGEPVVILRRPPPPNSGSGLLVLTPTMQGDPKGLAKVQFDGPTLIVLPKHPPVPSLAHPGWVSEHENFPPAEIASRLLAQLAPGTVVERAAGKARPVLTGQQDSEFEDETYTPGPVKDLQTIRGPNLQPLLVDAQGRIVLAGLVSKDRQWVYILAEPDLLNTAGIADIATARVADRLLRGLRWEQGPILFDVTLQGYQRERTLLRSILGPPYLAMTGCLLFTAFLMGLHAFARFGPTRRGGRVFAFGKQALADNAADLVRMARREPRMGPPYVALTRAIVARALTAPRGMSDAELDAFFDRLGAKAGTTHTWSALIARAAKPRDAYEMLAVARDIHAWRREMTRES